LARRRYGIVLHPPETMKRVGSVILLAAVGTLAVFVAMPHSDVGFLHAEETEVDEPPTVSEADLQMYIKVYSAMQDDHDLVIDSAIKPYGVTLEDFRQIERRIQGEARLVERVRQALLEHAKERSAFAQAVGTPSAPAAAAPLPTAKKKKDKKK